MKLKLRWQLVFWGLLSAVICGLVGVIGSFWTSFRLSEMNNSSSAGDPAAAPPEVIWSSIIRYCGPFLFFDLIILWALSCLMFDLVQQLATANEKGRARAALFPLIWLAILAAILLGAPIWVGLDYWRERAPYFPK